MHVLRFAFAAIVSFSCQVLPGAETTATPPTSPTSKRGQDHVDQLGKDLQPSRAVVYKRVGDRELSLHLFEPEGFKPTDQRPGYIVIHGGGWGGMTPARMFPFAAHYARLGMVGISVQYRLYNPRTDTTVFDCVKDARSAVRYVRAHARELGIAPDKLVVSGGSAGGHLAAATALFDSINEADEDPTVSCRPDALVLLFPVIDTSAQGYGQAKIGPRWQELSPVHHVRPGLPPTLLFHGTGDTVTPYRGAQLFHEAMLKAGNICEMESHAGGAHGYLMRTEALYDSTQARTETFLKKLGYLPVR